MRRARRSSWAPMLRAVCVWACYVPAWAVSGLSGQAWLGNAAYRGADLVVSLLLLTRHGMPGSVRWRHPILLLAGVYHAAASGLFAMAVGWCGPLPAGALYELWPLWAGLFMELYPRPVAGSGSRVWRLLRGGALSVSGAALVVWSQSGRAATAAGCLPPACWLRWPVRADRSRRRRVWSGPGSGLRRLKPMFGVMLPSGGCAAPFAA